MPTVNNETKRAYCANCSKIAGSVQYRIFDWIRIGQIWKWICSACGHEEGK